MDQQELNREVARTTGESLETIEAMGFSVMSIPSPLVIVDHRTRLRDLTRRQPNRRQSRDRKPGGTAASVTGGNRRRSAAFRPEHGDMIIPFPNPNIRKLTFDPWGA